MKWPLLVILPAALLLWAGCKKEAAQVAPEPPTFPAEKPVVSVAPVPTRPFEDGYDAGFEFGKQQGAPHAKLPGDDVVQRLAHERAEGHSERTERWERGFVNGYLDGFRNVVTGKK